MTRIGKKRRRLDPVFPPPDVGVMIQVSPLAILAMVAVAMDLLHIARALPGVALHPGIEYVAGLIFLGRRATAAKINRLLGGVSHDALTRLREQGRFNVSTLALAFVRLVQSLGVRGYLCLDDTLIPHERGKKMRGVYWDHDHALGRHVFGSRLVVLLWTDGFFRIPVAFAFWHKKDTRPKYRTKNEIARTLLRWAIHKGIQPEYVTFDNWYASKENMKLIVKELGLEFVTRLKKNARLLWNGRRLQARTIGRRLLAERPVRKRNGTWARATQVVVGELGAMTFVVVKNDLDGQGVGVRFLLGSAPREGAARVVERYKSRWIIGHSSVQVGPGRRRLSRRRRSSLACKPDDPGSRRLIPPPCGQGEGIERRPSPTAPALCGPSGRASRQRTQEKGGRGGQRPGRPDGGAAVAPRPEPSAPPSPRTALQAPFA